LATGTVGVSGGGVVIRGSRVIARGHVWLTG